jgi:Domain of unknown function (DUF3395)
MVRIFKSINIFSNLICIILQLHEGIKKSGIMGFCDPCPGEPKQLLVEYTFNGQNYKVISFFFYELDTLATLRPQNIKPS